MKRCRLKKYGKVKNKGSFVKGVVCPVKNRGKILIHNLIKTFPPIFFTGHKTHPPGIGIEDTAPSTKLHNFVTMVFFTPKFPQLIKI